MSCKKLNNDDEESSQGFVREKQNGKLYSTGYRKGWNG